MAASCVDQLLGISATSSLSASWVPRASPQLLRVSAANCASIPMPIPGQALHFHQRSSKHTVSASKKKRSPILDFDDDEEDEEDSDDEDNGILDMEEWMKNKPAGFGGTKVYDTSLEDRLLEEIKRDELAQVASKNKKPTPAVKPAKKPGNDVPPDGVEVFVKNLPRKKNVERDMRVALRSVSGLLHIRPLVSGNEKTREPVCKGLAFLTFATQDDAEEFVERYNDESIVFGKVEKRIICELAKYSSPYKENSSSSPTQAANGPRLGVRDPSSGAISIVTSSTTSLLVENAVVVEVASEVKKWTRNLPSSAKGEAEGPRNGDDSSEEDDADLFVLEQQIWDELENEEDFDLDLELEAEIEVLEGDSREPSASSFSEEGSNFTLSDGENVRQLEDDDENRPQVSGQGFGRSTIFVESRAVDRVSKKKSVESLDSKEKKIRELEAKLEELQSQLNKRNSIEFPKATDAKVNVQERKIESLEKRLLSRSKAGKDTNVSNGKPASASGKSVGKNVPKNSQKVSQDKKSKQQPRLKLGASSRLKKREREIFTEALSKYSAPSRD